MNILQRQYFKQKFMLHIFLLHIPMHHYFNIIHHSFTIVKHKKFLRIQKFVAGNMFSRAVHANTLLYRNAEVENYDILFQTMQQARKVETQEA